MQPKVIIEVTISATGKTAKLSHEVKNRGKITEEHHFSFVLNNGNEFAHYVFGKDEADALKRYL